MRLFIAAEFDGDVRERMVRVQSQVMTAVEGGRPTPCGQLHLTLAFLGETDPALVKPLNHIMDGLDRPSIPVRFNRVGRFLSSGGDTWWLGTDHCNALSALWRQLAAELSRAGVSFDKKRFIPHITLARRCRGGDPRLIAIEPIDTAVGSICLIQSQLLPSGPRYTTLHRTQFRA